MYLKTKGKPSKVAIKICKDALKFYGRQLLGDNLYHRVSIDLFFDKDLIKSNVYAYCDWEDSNYKAKEFTIAVDPTLGKRSMLIAIAHEMVHVKQYAKGELKDYMRNNKSKWKSEIIDPDQLDYWEYPWEIEAHGREKGLYVKFMEYTRSK